MTEVTSQPAIKKSRRHWLAAIVYGLCMLLWIVLLILFSRVAWNAEKTRDHRSAIVGGAITLGLIGCTLLAAGMRVALLREETTDLPSEPPRPQ